MSKLISHRVHYTSLKHLIEDLLPRWSPDKPPDFSGEDGREKLKGLLQRFGEQLLWSIQMDLEKGAAKGIQETLALIQDPDYYETIKQRRKRDRARSDEYRKAQESEQQRKAAGILTEEEKEKALRQLDSDEKYHRAMIERIFARKSQLERVTPSTLDEGEWPDELFGGSEW